LALFSKKGECDRSFQKSDCAITLFVAFFKRATREKIPESHFFRYLKRAITHFQEVQLPNLGLGICTFAHWLFCSSHFFALFKTAIVPSLFCCSFQKSYCLIALFVAPFKRAIV